jgi:hypothetical protein
MKVNWLSIARVVTVVLSQSSVIIGAMNFIPERSALLFIGIANALYLTIKCIDGEIGVDVSTLPPPADVKSNQGEQK